MPSPSLGPMGNLSWEGDVQYRYIEKAYSRSSMAYKHWSKRRLLSRVQKSLGGVIQIRKV
jgi:hypothetical protein